jgi:hypothetical protein
LSKEASEDNNERIDFLKEQIEQAKQTYQNSLKNVVQECIQLEITALEKSEKAMTSDLLYCIASAINTHQGSEADPHQKVVNLLTLDRHLFKYSPKKDILSVASHYKTHHGLQSLPSVTIIIANAEYSTAEARANALSSAAASMQRPEKAGIQLLCKAIAAILVELTHAYLQQKAKNDREIALKKLTTELLDGKATEDATMELDAEGGTDKEHLKDLIRKECDKRDKKYEKLAAKYTKLEKELSAKNEKSRGRQKDGATGKNKPQKNKTGNDKSDGKKKKSQQTSKQQENNRS